MLFELGVVVIDLEEDFHAANVEEGHIMLAVRVIVGGEVVEGANSRKRALEEVVAPRRYPARDDKLSVDDEPEDWVAARAQRVVELADARHVCVSAPNSDPVRVSNIKDLGR